MYQTCLLNFVEEAFKIDSTNIYGVAILLRNTGQEETGFQLPLESNRTAKSTGVKSDHHLLLFHNLQWLSTT